MDLNEILVTGANGYLGQGIVKSILNHGHKVIAADLSTDFVDERAYKAACDLFAVDNPYNYFGNPDVLLHLAWKDDFKHYSDSHIDSLPRHYIFLKSMAEAEGKDEFPFTTGQNQYDFIDYNEFCLQAASAVGQDKINGIIELCSGKPEKLSDRAERFIEENGFRINE